MQRHEGGFRRGGGKGVQGDVMQGDISGDNPAAGRLPGQQFPCGAQQNGPMIRRLPIQPVENHQRCRA